MMNLLHLNYRYLTAFCHCEFINMAQKLSCDCKDIERKVQRNYYRYYDTPDGCDIFKKVR